MNTYIRAFRLPFLTGSLVPVRQREYNNPEKIVPAQALILQTHLALGLRMVLGHWVR